MATQIHTRFDDARRAMIDSQLRTSGVNEPFVLKRMGDVRREEFVPEAQRAAAYMDRAVRLPDGGFLPAPVFHGMMLAEANPQADDHAVVVDGGSGYLSALLEPLVASLVTIDPQAAVDGKLGKTTPTLLLIDGAIEHLPDALVAKLDDGTRIVTGLIERGVTRLAAGRKVGGSLALVPLTEVGVPRMAAFDRASTWSF